MTTTSDIITRARGLLVDTGVVQRWSDAELLRYLSDGQRTIAFALPSESNKIATMKLKAGTRQIVPNDGHLLLGITRNMGSNGTTPGRAVRIVSREVMDAQNPTWHSDLPSSTTYNFIYDPQDQLSFFVYPPSDGTNYLEINYAFIPAELLTTSDLLTINEGVRTPLLDYVMFRAHQKESDFAAGQALSQSYFSTFTQFLQARLGGEATENPNLQLGPTNPQVKGAAKI